MSITFWAPEAPVEEVCAHPEFGPGFVVQQRELAEVHLAGSFGRDVLVELGLPGELTGDIAPQALATVRERIDALLAAPDDVAPPAPLFALANDAHEKRYLRTRLAQLAELLAEAAQRGWRVCWG